MDARPQADEAAESEGPDLSHNWIVAAEVPVDHKTAKHADLRLSFRAAADQRIDALEVYCKGCRRPFEDVADLPCEAKIDNRHLIGGDQSVRAKRKMPVFPEGTRVVPGPPINRRGIDAVLSREA